MSTGNVLGISLIYCICGDIDDESTSKVDGTNGIDTLMDDVISDDDIDGKSKARNIYEVKTCYVENINIWLQTNIVGLGTNATVYYDFRL